MGVHSFLMTSIEEKNSDVSAFPSASQQPEPPQVQVTSMEEDLVVINTRKEQLEWVQIALEGDFEASTVSAATKAIQDHCFTALRINVAKIVVDKSKRCLSVCFESKEAADLFFQSNLQAIISTGAQMKKTTSNPELDSRRIRLSILGAGKTDMEFTRRALTRFGEVEDFYETSGQNSVKRSFTVAFKHGSSKETLEKEKFVTIGNVVYKVEKFNSEGSGTIPKEKPILLKLYGISVRNSDLNLKSLMTEMKAVYWHFVRSKRGIKMPIVMVEFAEEAHKNQAMAIIWNFQGKRLSMSEPEKKCCYICGCEEDLSPECPKKKTVIVKEVSKNRGLSAKVATNEGRKELTSKFKEVPDRKPNSSLEPGESSQFAQLTRTIFDLKKKVEEIEKRQSNFVEKFAAFLDERAENNKILEKVAKDTEENRKFSSSLENALCQLTISVHSIIVQTEKNSSFWESHFTSSGGPGPSKKKPASG